jgi:hypothetical protein
MDSKRMADWLLKKVDEAIPTYDMIENRSRCAWQPKSGPRFARMLDLPDPPPICPRVTLSRRQPAAELIQQAVALKTTGMEPDMWMKKKKNEPG